MASPPKPDAAVSSVRAEAPVNAAALQNQTPREMHSAVWHMAWPTVVANLLGTLNGILDAFFVGGLPHSRQALAATGTGGQVLFLLISIAIGLSVGTGALVSRFTGASDHEAACKATGQSLSLGFTLGLASGLLVLVFRSALTHLILGKTNTLSTLYCSQFLELGLLSTAPNFVINSLIGTFRGLGDMKTPLRIQLGVIAVHMSCDWMFIYGHLGMPALGVRGAGLALTLSTTIGMVLFIAALYRRSAFRDAFQLDNLLPSADWYRRILRISIPASIRGMARTLAMAIYTAMLARTLEGSAAVAAISIAIRAEAIAFMPGISYSIATSTLVGQSLGAVNPRRAERATHAAALQAVSIMTIVGICFIVLAEPLCRIITSDPSVVGLGSQYLRINAISEPFFGLGIVLQGALQGAGDTARPTWITLISMWCLRLPLGWLLMFPAHMEARGAWYAICISSIVNNLLIVPFFVNGKWKTREV